MTTAQEDFAAEVKRRRIRLGLSRAEFGARIGMHRNNIHKIEKGTSDLQLSTMLRFANGAASIACMTPSDMPS